MDEKDGLERVRARRLGLALPIAALFCLLDAPNRFGPLLGGTSATAFIGALLGACMVVSLVAALRRRLTPWQPCMLAPLAVLGVMLWGGLGSIVTAVVLGALGGAGIGSGLLACATPYLRPDEDALLPRSLESFAIAGILMLPCALLPADGLAVWMWYLVVCVAMVPAARFASVAVPSLDPPGRSMSRRVLPGGLWQPVAGLALSLMSASLTWGAFLSGSSGSVPPLFSTLLGWLLPWMLALVPPLRRTLAGVPYPTLLRIGMPVLAALVVVLWMVGDVTEIAFWATVLKGVFSGAVGCLFFCFAWTSLVEADARLGFAGTAEGLAARSDPADTTGDRQTVPIEAGPDDDADVAALGSARDDGGICAAGLAACFFCATAILTVHAVAGQTVAARMTPVLSLLFLVAVCIDAVRPRPNAASAPLDHMSFDGKTTRATGYGTVSVALPRTTAGTTFWTTGPTAHDGLQGAAGNGLPQPDLRERALDSVAQTFGLSPREREVLAHLCGGRSVEGIGEALGISPNTVRAHVRHIHEKLGLSSRDEIVRLVDNHMTRG